MYPLVEHLIYFFHYPNIVPYPLRRVNLAIRLASSLDIICMELPVLWLITGAQPYASTEEQETHTLKPRRSRPSGIWLLHLHFIYILSIVNRIHFVSLNNLLPTIKVISVNITHAPIIVLLFYLLPRPSACSRV